MDRLSLHRPTTASTAIEFANPQRKTCNTTTVTKAGLLFSALIAFVLLPCVVRGEPGNLSTATINYVLDRNGTYIATTSQGLYQATDTEKIWRKMPTPDNWPHFFACLAQQSPSSPKLACYAGMEFGWADLTKATGLWISGDTGKHWTQVLKENVSDAFIHPDGSLYAVVGRTTTTPFPPGADSISSKDAGGIVHYPSIHLLVSRDDGRNWDDITPQLRSAFGLWGIAQDPDHADLVCVRSNEIAHLSRTFIFQATDKNYHWQEYQSDEWHHELSSGDDLFVQPMSGTATSCSDMPANLENFFKFPYPRNGRYPELPTYFLKAEKTAYRFRLHQPMPIKVSSFFLDAGAPITVTDHPDPQIFWGLKVQPKGGVLTGANPKTVELNTAYSDHEAKLAAYTNDPHNFRIQVDQQHPYERTINLLDLYDFKQPGTYRVALFITSIYMDRKTGSSLGTQGIDLTITP